MRSERSESKDLHLRFGKLAFNRVKRKAGDSFSAAATQARSNKKRAAFIGKLLSFAIPLSGWIKPSATPSS
jgi:hypothetical protein